MITAAAGAGGAAGGGGGRSAPCPPEFARAGTGAGVTGCISRAAAGGSSAGGNRGTAASGQLAAGGAAARKAGDDGRAGRRRRIVPLPRGSAATPLSGGSPSAAVSGASPCACCSSPALISSVYMVAVTGGASTSTRSRCTAVPAAFSARSTNSRVLSGTSVNAPAGPTGWPSRNRRSAPAVSHCTSVADPAASVDGSATNLQITGGATMLPADSSRGAVGAGAAIRAAGD